MPALVVFLGNPGALYKHNRHNAGRLLAEKLSCYPSINWQKKYKGLYASVDLAPSFDLGPSLVRVHFLMPETYMNLSGHSVQAAAFFHKIKPGSIIAVHDELELPLGCISLKYGGGLGGHNGLRSMKDRLGTADFWRIRIGIGRPAGRAPGQGGPGCPLKGNPSGSGGDVSGWVLSDFSAAEQPALEAALEAGAELLIRAVTEDPQSLLDEWKKKRVL